MRELFNPGEEATDKEVPVVTEEAVQSVTDDPVPPHGWEDVLCDDEGPGGGSDLEVWNEVVPYEGGMFPSAVHQMLVMATLIIVCLLALYALTKCMGKVLQLLAWKYRWVNTLLGCCSCVWSCCWMACCGCLSVVDCCLAGVEWLQRVCRCGRREEEVVEPLSQAGVGRVEVQAAVGDGGSGTAVEEVPTGSGKRLYPNLLCLGRPEEDEATTSYGMPRKAGHQKVVLQSFCYRDEYPLRILFFFN